MSQPARHPVLLSVHFSRLDMLTPIILDRCGTEYIMQSRV